MFLDTMSEAPDSDLFEEEVLPLAELDLDQYQPGELVLFFDKGRTVTTSVEDARALLEIRERRAAASKKGEKKKRGRSTGVSAADLEDDEEDAAREKTIEKRFVFVEDEEGDELGPPVAAPPTKKKRKPRKEKTGPVQKTPDRVVVDAREDWLSAKDGGKVRINVAKRMMVQVTEKQLEGEYKGMKDSKSEPLTTDHWECLLGGDKFHQRFHKIGKEIGNLGKHCRKSHKEVWNGVVRLIEETPAESCVQVVQEFIATVTTRDGSSSVPPRSLKALLKRDVSANISQECAALVWFLDAQIPFAQFDNPIFKEFLTAVAGSENVQMLASSTTIVRSILPAMYHYVTEKIKEEISSWKAFYNTFDGWSKYQQSFISQHYHGINPASFEFRIYLLDLLYFPVQKFAETVAAGLSQRSAFWTADMHPAPLLAGGLADQAANVQVSALARCFFSFFLLESSLSAQTQVLSCRLRAGRFGRMRTFTLASAMY